MTDPLHDPEILEAYDRLGTSLTTTGDPLPDLERGIRHRRVVRRAVAGGAALALVAGVGGFVALQRGGGDDLAAVDQPSATPTGPVSTLSFTRTDGSTYTFSADSLATTCEKAPDGGGQVLRLMTGEPKVDPANQDALVEPLFIFEVSVDGLTAGQRFDLPFESADGSSDSRMLTVFFATPEGGKRANELSSAESGSSGTVTVDSATCGPTPAVSFSVDATLGSELNQPAMALTGSYRP